MAYVKIKGKTYGIHTGSRGGRYWIDDAGKKHYLKNTEPKQDSKKVESKKIEPKKEVPKLKKWICRYSEEVDGDHDGFSEWCEAYTEHEARYEFEDRYRHNPRVTIDYIYEE